MTPTLGKLYLAEIRKNVTHDVKLRIGYFGGCVSVANIPNESGISIDDSSDPSQTHCVVNMRGHDEDDLSEEFWEGFDLDTPAMNSLNATLNEILPLVRHLQKDVFNYAAPLAHVVLFVVSAIMLGVAAVGSSARRGYRVALVLAVIVSAFALSLALDTALGSARALNALIDGNGDTEGRKLYDGLYINRAHVLERIQAVQVSIVAVFYVIMGAMYALR
jgi:hypothetical protein